MTTDFRSETFELSTDNHLADRAKLGSTPAFDELVQRHADTAIATAMVVTGDASAAVALGARAFTDVLDQMATGGYSIDDPYLPGLIRSSRELALTDPGADPALRERMDTRLPELARSTRWLTTAMALDAEDLALALDVEDTSVAGIIGWSDAVVADHAQAVDSVLASVHVLIPTTLAVEARSIWRRWLATTGVAATGSAGGGVVAIESVASRVLRGAAVLLIVAGAVGAAAGIARRGDDGGDVSRIAQRSAVEQPMDRNQGPASGGDGFTTSGAERALAGTDVGSITPTVMTPTPMVITPVGAAQGVRVMSATADAGSSWMWNRAKAAVTGTAPARSTRATSSTRGATATPARSGAPASSSPAQPAMPMSPPATPGNPTGTNGAGPSTGPGTGPMMPPVSVPVPPKPPVTGPPMTFPPVTAPPVTLPPVTVPPVTLPPLTVPPVLAPVVNPVTGALGGLLGGR